MDDLHAHPFPPHVDPQAWTWYVDQLHSSLRTIKRPMETADDILMLLEAIDLIAARTRATSVRRTRFVVTA